MFYPTLPDAPRAALVSELFRGGGGVLAFEVQGGVDAAEIALKVWRAALRCAALAAASDATSRCLHAMHRILRVWVTP